MLNRFADVGFKKYKLTMGEEDSMMSIERKQMWLTESELVEVR
jgi:hypothetical protein